MKATSVAPANIAFIKYWGKKNEVMRIPENGSISMNLSNLLTTATVEFNRRYEADLVIINGQENLLGKERVIEHLNRIRKLANLKIKAKVVFEFNFPIGTGLSSSAAGFAALTLAGSKAAGLRLPEKELSILARLGSGSACRSIPDGFVEWLAGNTSETSYAVSIFPSAYWQLADVVVIVNTKVKDVPTTEGQKLHHTSPFFQTRLINLPDKIKRLKQFIRDRDFINFGELIEAEALELHSIMLTSKPALIYWTPETIKLMKLVRKWRDDGLPVYFTINTGQNIHLITEKKNVEEVKDRLKQVIGIKQVITDYPANGVRLIDKHLF